MKKYIYIRHIAGEYDEVEKKQFCVICGFVICDYSNAMWPNGQPPPKGWGEGELYVSKATNPQSFQRANPAGIFEHEGQKYEHVVVDCKYELQHQFNND